MIRHIAPVLAALLVSVHAEAALPAVQPLAVRVGTNGFAAFTADQAKARLNGFWPHVYAHAAPGVTTPGLLYDAYFGLRVGAGPGVWAPELPHPQPFSACQPGQPCAGDDAQFGYVGATGVVHDLRIQAGIRMDTQAFAPMSLLAPGMVVLATVHNTTAQPAQVDIALLLNLHVGAGAPPSPDDERIRVVAPHALVEDSAKSAHRVLYRALAGATDPPLTALDVVNPYTAWTQGKPFATAQESIGSDRVAGLAWSGIALAAGQSRTVGVLVLYGAKATDKALLDAADAWLAQRTAPQVLADEMAGWAAWHAADVMPPGLDATEQLLLRRSLATLRMAQVREPDTGPPHQNLTPHGQIVASLPPGIWNIAWVRDGAYAGVALAVAGHGQEARAALDFTLHGQTGGYEAYMGGPYLVSPVRWFGGGLEEADTDQDGPNIEFDGIGLFLWQAARYVQATNDAAWLAGAWPDLRDKAANRLVDLVDTNGLVKADSGPWEVHWNGKQKHFTYTSLTAIRGLCAAAQLSVIAGEGKLALGFRKTARQIRDAVIAHLIGADQVLRGNTEEPPAQALDAAAVEAFLDGTLDVAGPVALATWLAWQKALSAGGGPGLVRNDDGGEYDSQEWLFIDLRVLRMLERMAAAGQPVGAAAQALRQRVRAVAQAGGGLLPELLGVQGQGAGQFAGATPMAGFGAGALALALGGDTWGDDLASCLQDPVTPADPDMDAGSADTAEDAGADTGSVDDAGFDTAATDGGPDAASLADVEILGLLDTSSRIAPPATPKVATSGSAGGCAASTLPARGRADSAIPGLLGVLALVGYRLRRNAAA